VTQPGDRSESETEALSAGIGTRLLSGVGAAPGLAVGSVWRYRAPGSQHGATNQDAAHLPRAATIVALEAAANAAADQLGEVADRVRALGRGEEAAIFDAQSLMALDPSLIDGARSRMTAGDSPVDAIRGAADEVADQLAALPDELIAARASDVRDVAQRIVRILLGEVLQLPGQPSIAVADDLPPSVTAEIPAGLLLGICLAGGSRTSHAVILARALGIPAVVGVDGLLISIDSLTPEAVIAIDGSTGEVVLEPDEAHQAAFRDREARRRARLETAAHLRNEPGSLADGSPVQLAANIGVPEDAPRALAAGAEGVGLFRTEFLFMSRLRPPSEAEQADAYRRVFESFGPDRPVVVRLADIGGDKQIPYLDLPAEANPFLGVRAIRLAYRSRELLVTQLRAISSAGAAAGVVPHVMAPMIATIADVELFRSLIDEAQEGLLAEGRPGSDRIAAGIMVEVPSAAVLAADLAPLVDFFSIGTNDLTQYTLAADRGNPILGPLQDALHPAVLRLIAGVVDGARMASVPVAVCGELAGDPAGALVLVGLGVDELSLDAGGLDEVRLALSSVTRPEVESLAAAALRATDAETVRALAAKVLARSTNDATGARR
jgi:phosphotransferase system enzyme I (PtsI)